jgi:hypothetical protein
MQEPPNREAKRTVGAPADHHNCRLVETLYKTKIPQSTAWADHFFELTLGEETINGKLRYFVRETDCRWDAAAQHTVRVQYTLSPRGGFERVEQAHEKYQQQRIARAQRGFVHSYAPSYEAATHHRKYVRIEIGPGAGSEEKT